MARGPRWGGLLVVFLVGLGAAGWWLWDLYRASNRTDLSSFWQLVVAVVTLGVALVPLGKDWLASREVGDDGGVALDRLADRLEDAVYRQWARAAAERGLLQPDPIEVRWSQPSSVAGSAEAATVSRRFLPIAGLAATGPEQLCQGGLRDLHAIYGGLGSGRLVIVGSPGSGKSGAAVLLVLAAVEHRRAVEGTDRARVPVPVLFTFAGWDPSTPLRDWLVSQLRQTYEGLFIGRRGGRSAAKLLDEGKITVVLDGLDEIPEQLRPDAIQALSEQAGFRLVILSRHDEMALAVKKERLLGAVAVRLDDVDPDAAADYLERVQSDPPPDQWRELVKRLRSAPASPLARALSNPLTLTLVRDTYREGDSVGDLLDFCDTTGTVSREAVEDYLLDRVLSQAYRQRPGHPPPRYSLATAQHTLQLIASRMRHDSPDPHKPSRDLAWWRIPTWTPTLPRALIIGAANGLAVWFGLEATFELFESFGQIEVLIGFVSGLGGMLGAWSASRNLLRTVPTRWHYVFSHPSLVFVLGLVFGFLFQGLSEMSFSAWFGLWFASHIGMWLVLGLAVGIGIWVAGKALLRTPVRWRLVFGHPAVTFALGLGLGAAVSLVTAEFLGVRGLSYGFGLIPLLGVVFGLRLGLGWSGEGSVSALTPLASWKRWRAGGLGVWFGLGLLSALLVVEGSVLDPQLGLGAAFGCVFVSGLMLGLIYPETWTTSLACVQLAIRQRTPFQLMRFLDDAHKRGILRTVGPLYQFRHARLQDRLTELNTTTTVAGLCIDLVALDDATPAAAADYLERVRSDPPPDQWRELIDRLRNAPTSPLARALSNPSTLTLVRDIYRESDSVQSLLDFCDSTDNLSREAVEDYLLDQVLPQAYRQRPGHPPPRYSLTAAQHTLQLIAARMNQDHTRDLGWWRIPTWTPTLPRALIIGAASGLAIWLGFGLLYRSFWLTFFGNLVGLSSGLGGILGAWLASKKTLQTAPTRWQVMFSHPSLGFMAGVVFGFMFSFDLTGIVPVHLLIGVCYGLVAGLAIWLVVGLVIRLAGKTRNRIALARWRSVYKPLVVFGFGLGFTGAYMIYNDLGRSALILGGVLVGLFVLGAGLRIGLGSLGQDSGGPPLPPFVSWSQHRVAGLGIWFVLGGLVGGFLVRAGIRGWSLLSYSTPHLAIAFFLMIGFVSGLILGLIYPETWTTSLACAQLAIRQRTPLQLMRFLNDAHKRGILCADDSIYQFRHPRLQDRLTDQAHGVRRKLSDQPLMRR